MHLNADSQEGKPHSHLNKLRLVEVMSVVVDGAAEHAVQVLQPLHCEALGVGHHRTQQLTESLLVHLHTARFGLQSGQGTELKGVLGARPCSGKRGSCRGGGQKGAA